VTSWNEGAKRLKGWEAQEILGSHFSRFYPEGAVAAGRAAEELRIAASEGQFSEEGIRVRKDGTEFFADVSITAIHDQNGKLRGFAKVTRDITERKRTEDILRNSHNELEACVEKRTEELKNLNDTLEEQVIERTAQLKSANETLLASRRAALNLMEDAVIARKQAEETSTELRLEIEERKRAEESIRESELFYSQTLESIPGMVFTTRPDGYCDFQSRQWVEFTGVPMKEHLGDGWNRLLHPDDRPRAYDAWRAAVDGKAPYDLEYRVRRHDGEYEWFKVIGRPIRDAAGQIGKWFGVAVNMEANKRAEEELQVAKEEAESANRAKSLFLANMSHELRTPMTGVLGMLEIARSGHLDEKQREAIYTAHMSGQSLLMILNDILDLTRIETGKLAIKENSFAMRECMTGAVDILIPAARKKGLDLHWSIAEEMPETLLGDRIRLQQVLTNLVGNAVKFTERGKVEVTVTAGSETADGKREITFKVSDTGIGIPAEKKELIFEAFNQADISHSRQYGGTGLGLSISKELVELMGGAITLESVEGKGSSFSFSIPLLGASPESASAPETSTAPPAEAAVYTVAEKGKARLLVAEDDEVTRKVLGFMLQRSGFDYEFAMDGRKAVEMWEQGGYDLVVMDGQMPVMDGFAATAAIRERERERGGHIPILAMTAHALETDKERCLACGMDAYVSKPIDFKKCMEVIRGLLGQGGR
jgi:PAS domain S-box-containing protein